MASDQYTGDVLIVAQAIFVDVRWRHTVAAWSEEPIDLSDLDLELAVPDNSLTSAIAGQSVIKLAFDAAIVATAWVFDEAKPFDHASASELIDAHADDVIFSQLELGSFLARYRLDPRKNGDRQRIFAILTGLGIALQYVSFAFPPATLPVLIIGTALAAPQILTNFFMPDPDSPLAEAEPETAEGASSLQLDITRLPPGTQITITLPGEDLGPALELGYEL